MTTQTPITNIAAALALAQNEIAVADKNAVNTEHKSRFADMESVTGACREALAKVGISILQPLGGSATELLVKTVLLHSSGEFLESEFILRPENPNDTDAVKSLITQMRRYSLMGMLCIATADDDGANGKTPKKPEKKAPVQNPGEVIEKYEAETPADPETVTTVETNEDWKEVVCHYGSDTSPAKDKKLGELEPDVLKFVQEKVLPALGKTKKDRALAAAIEESVKAQSTPATAPNTLPEPEKPVEPAKNAKETASSEPPQEPEPMEWRSVVTHNFLNNPKLTLGEIADAKMDEVAKGWDGPKLIREIKKTTGKLTQSTKDKILANAIIAANEEMDARERVVALFDGVDFDGEKATEFLKSIGIFEEETIGDAPVKLLNYIVTQWSMIESRIKEVK